MSYKNVSHGFTVEAKLLDNSNNELYDISSTIQSIMVKKAFLENSFPLYVFDIRCTEEQRNLMRDNAVSVRLIISYYNSDTNINSEDLDRTEIGLEGKVYDGIIRIYDKPFATTLAKHDEEIEGNEENNQSKAAPFVYYRMSGIPEELISKNESSVNMVYKNCELADAVVHMISSIDTQSNVYMQETVNKTVHPFILVPPLSLVPALKHIDNNYMHCYEHPASFFIDDSGIYFYDMFSNDTPKTNMLEVRVLDSKITTNSEVNTRPAIDENNNVQMIYKVLPAFSKTTPITTHELGSHTIYYFYDDNFKLVTDSEENKDSYEKVRYVWEKLSDKAIKTSNYDKAIAIAIPGLNPALINPLTIVKVSAQEYPEATGDYGIVESSYMLSSNDGKHYSSTLSIQAIKK